MEEPELPKAWVCIAGHVNPYPGTCHSTVYVRQNTTSRTTSCGLETVPIGDYPELEAAWRIGGLAGYKALWAAKFGPGKHDGGT